MKRGRGLARNGRRFVDQPRDHVVLRTLFEARIATRDQLAVFGSFSSVSRLNRRLRQYVKAGLVSARPADWPRGPQFVYCLEPEAAALLGRVLDLSVGQVRREINRRVSRTMTEHALRIGDLHLAFLASSRAIGVQVWKWLPERLSHHRFLTRPAGSLAWRSLWAKPDACLILETPAGRRHFLIEADLGSVSTTKLRLKLGGYALYRRGAFQEVYQAAGFAILIITTDAARANLIGKLADEAGSVPTLVTTFEALGEASALSEVWRSGRYPDEVVSPLDPRLWPRPEGDR